MPHFFPPQFIKLIFFINGQVKKDIYKKKVLKGYYGGYH